MSSAFHPLLAHGLRVRLDAVVGGEGLGVDQFIAWV